MLWRYIGGRRGPFRQEMTLRVWNGDRGPVIILGSKQIRAQGLFRIDLRGYYPILIEAES